MVQQDSRADQPFRLQLLDGFGLVSPTGKTVPVTNRKACGMLAYMVLQPTGSASRERLAGLLWSDRSEDKARASLRQALKKLKFELHEAGFYGLSIGRSEIVVEAGSVTIDLLSVFDGFSNPKLEAIAIQDNQIPERVLYGFESLDPSFNTWLQVIRQNWSDSYVQVLEQSIDTSDLAKAKLAAETILKIDPSHEGAHRYLISHHATSGNTALAMRQYQTLWDLLDSEYDMEPDEATQALIVDVKLGLFNNKDQRTQDIASAQEVPAAGKSTKNSQAPVLEIWNFVQGGEWHQESYFVEGFRRELIASLVRFREWIIAEGSIENGIGMGDQGVQACDYRLEGSYLEQNDDVKLVITLREISTNRYIWSEQISIAASDWVTAQHSIVRRISLALGFNLSAERLTRDLGKQSVEPVLYDLWLRGQSLTMQWRPEAHNQANEIFRSILDKDPGFGRAYSSLVQVENAASLLQPGVCRTPQSRQHNVDMARAAVAIDPLDTRAILHLGWALAINHQFDHAEINLDLAGETNPNDHWTLVSVAAGLAFCGCHEKALKLAQQVLTLAPAPTKTHWGYIGVIYFICGQFEQCVSALEKADNVLIILPAWAAAAYYHLGRYDDAARSCKTFLDLVKDFSDPRKPITETDVTNWLLQCFPIKERKTFERFKDGIVGAGIPAPISEAGTGTFYPQRANV